MSAVLGRTDENMREPAGWMVGVDDRILELVNEFGNLTPRAIEKFGATSSSDHASRRAGKLVKAGLLYRIDRGLYGITDEGVAYLEEELDASTLPHPDDVEESPPNLVDES